jgi:nitrogen fixation protein NifU and related proteins
MGIEYNEKVLAHFLDPHNVGMIEDPDGVGQLGDPSCGDVFLMFIKVRQDRLADIKYLVRGCGAAIATCSALSDIAMGKTIDEALELNDDDIAAELGGLPLEKLHCSNLAATVLHLAITDYLTRGKKDLSDWRSAYLGSQNRSERSG